MRSGDGGEGLDLWIFVEGNKLSMFVWKYDLGKEVYGSKSFW